MILSLMLLQEHRCKKYLIKYDISHYLQVLCVCMGIHPLYFKFVEFLPTVENYMKEFG